MSPDYLTRMWLQLRRYHTSSIYLRERVVRSAIVSSVPLAQRRQIRERLLRCILVRRAAIRARERGAMADEQWDPIECAEHLDALC